MVQWSALVNALAWVSAGGLVEVPPDSPSLRLVGRFDYRLKVPRFDMNGCEISFRVRGAHRVEARLEQRMSPYVPGPLQPSGSQANDFMVFIDGVAQPTPAKGANCSFCTFDTTGARGGDIENYILADGLAAQEHEIRLFKATEPQWVARVPAPNWLSFHGLVLDGGEVLPPSRPRSKRRLEFVGDSITAGYCNLCKGPHEADIATTRMGAREGNSRSRRRRAAEGGPWEETFALGWPTRICEALDAECHTAAWSGFGMIENCCGGVTTMPQIWRRTLATDDSSRWDFSSWIPQGLVINLGTNDNVWARNASYSEIYFDMVLNASKAYGPDLNIFLACGPMEGPTIVYCPYVEGVVARAVASGIKAHFLDQRGFLNGTYGSSCCGHPSTRVDEAMSKHGAAFISKVLDWPSGKGVADGPGVLASETLRDVRLPLARGSSPLLYA